MKQGRFSKIISMIKWIRTSRLPIKDSRCTGDGEVRERVHAIAGEHGVGGCVVERKERGFSTFKASRAAQTVAAGEGYVRP